MAAKMVKVTALQTDTHAQIKELAALGFDGLWQGGTWRLLPQDLAERLMKRGIARPSRDDDLQSYNAAKPVEMKAVVDVEALREQYAKEPKVRVVCVTHGARFGWKDGNYIPHFEACDYPLEWFKGEVREIPVSLFRKIGGGNFEVTQAEPDPNRYTRWREEREARRKANAYKDSPEWKAERIKTIKTELANARGFPGQPYYLRLRQELEGLEGT